MQDFTIALALCLILFFGLAVAYTGVSWFRLREDDTDEKDNYPIEDLDDLVESLQYEILNEWAYARSKFGSFHSTHEGFAVLHEEFDELKAEVWKNGTKHPDRDACMRKEAIQVAAMALRFLTDCIPQSTGCEACDHDKENTK